MALSNIVATVGQLLGLPEMTISERLGNTAKQTVPSAGIGSSGLLGQAGYVSSPVSGGNSVYPISGGTYQSGPYQGQTAIGGVQQGNTSGYNIVTPQSSSPNPTPTPSSDVRSSGGTTPNVGDISGDGNYRWNGKSWEARFPSGFDSYQQFVDQTRNDITSGYNSYFSQLDSMLNNDLPSQRLAQEGIAQSQGTQAENVLGSQKTQGLADLATQTRQNEQSQAKNLQSLAEDVRNQFKAGQIYLGSRGAGDSSAANQYSYAIAKMGNQGRGNIMQQATEIRNQIADREFKLNNTYNTELNNIKEGVNQKILEIGNWFNNAQMQLKQAKANGELSKGQDLANLSKQLLQNATAQMMATQQEAANRRSMLDQWAMNNSTNINQLKGNLATVSNYQSPGIQSQGINGQLSTDTQGNVSYNQPGAGYGVNNTASTDWLKKLYGQQ